MNFFRHILFFSAFLVLLTGLSGCSATKHVPDGSLLLDKTRIVIEKNDSVPETKYLNPAEFLPYLRQVPNTTVLGFLKLQLATYNLSGKDSTKRANKLYRRLGQAPVIFEPEKAELSASQLRQALVNKGFSHAYVTIDSMVNHKKKKIGIRYTLHPGVPHSVKEISYSFPAEEVRYPVLADSAMFGIKPGGLFDRNRLEEQRVDITARLRDKGYYDFTKEYITFRADTAEGSRDVKLQMSVLPYGSITSTGGNTGSHQHLKYYINKVYAVTNYDPVTMAPSGPFECDDTVSCKGVTVLYGADRYLRPSIIEEKCFIEPGKPYKASEIDLTYESLAQLGILKYVNIVLKVDSAATAANPDRPMLNAYILMQKAKKQGVTLELEGTNSEGDLGFGVGVTYRHRNIFKGSELLTGKFRTSYESISGDLDGLINNRYTEFAAEVGLTFPKFLAPFVSKPYRKKSRAQSEVALTFNYQERPEYTRIIAGTGWKYKWNSRNNLVRNTFDVVDVNFVYLPNSTLNFLDEIAPANPLLRYSYEDHFIMRMGYTLNKTNKRLPNATQSAGSRQLRQKDVYSLRLAAETAGNLLYAASSLIGQRRQEGVYKIFGIQYAQYAKAEADWTFTRAFDSRNSMAFHIGGGVAIPYGNSAMVPFEKRFYAGGANGVRGWSVRTLGPGAYESTNQVSNFINQCGDIRLDMSIEYRARLFWVLEGALFVDAGNIWTIRNYENQPDGIFRFRNFYKELAGAYGAGIRFDFTYFLLRLDLGMKAHNPAMNQEKWPLLHPSWKRDATFHFAVGYPF